MTYPFTLTQDSVTVIVNGKPHTVQKGAPNFLALRTAILNENWEAVPKNLTVVKSIREWAKGKFSLSDDGRTFSYEGQTIPDSINSRIISMASSGESPEPLLKFWERLQRNPSMRSVEQLWPFLQHAGIPLTEDGCFLAYKGVNNDFTDKHTGTVDNKPGVINEMPRNKISDDPREACHYGYHVGALRYAKAFASRMIICKVDPEHVVCVPYDSSQEKMRVCKYEVIGNYGEQLPSTTFREDPMLENDLKKPDYIDPDNEEQCLDCHHDYENCTCDRDDDDDDDLDGDEGTEEPSGEEMKETKPPVLDGSALAASDVNRLGSGSKKETPAKPAPLPSQDKKKPNKGYAKFDKMDMTELIGCSLDDLRKYATYGLDIVGSSKIPGGKTALVAKILEVRA